jgi:hypothetical protein
MVGPPAPLDQFAAALDRVRGGDSIKVQGSPGAPRLLVEVEQRIQLVTDITGLLESWGYRGWVLPGRHWVPISAFPLAAHQARTSHVSERGLLARVLWPFPRYVNSVLFLPRGQIPSAAGAGAPAGHGRSEGGRT